MPRSCRSPAHLPLTCPSPAPPLPPHPEGREGVYPLSLFRGAGGGQLVKLEIDGGELVPPCPAGYASISRSLLYARNLTVVGIFCFFFGLFYLFFGFFEVFEVYEGPGGL